MNKAGTTRPPPIGVSTLLSKGLSRGLMHTTTLTVPSPSPHNFSPKPTCLAATLYMVPNVKIV